MINMLTESFQRYYGLDWLSFVFGFTGMYLITKKRKSGFLLSAVGYTTGIAAAVISRQFGFVAYDVALAIMMVRGYETWKADSANDASA